MTNKKLYNNIIRNVSREVKRALNEELEKFNPTDYDSDEIDIISHHDIRNVSYKYHPITNDELQEIINKKIKENKTYIDVSDIDVSNITDMSGIFQNTELIYIDISMWDTSNVTTMQSMFRACPELKKVNLKGINTSNVYDMGYMFAWCGKLQEIIGAEDFDGTKVQNMACMFRECFDLKEIDFSNFNASPETVQSMFYGCTKLKVLKMGNVKGNKLDFEILNPVEYIFNKCKKLEYVELSKSLTAAIALNKSASTCKCVLKNK